METFWYWLTEVVLENGCWTNVIIVVVLCLEGVKYLSKTLVFYGKEQEQMKIVLEETQTLRAGCSKAEPKNFALPQTLFKGVQERQNLISRRQSLPSPTDPVWRRLMHVILSYRGNRPTNTHRPPVTDRTDNNTHVDATLSKQCKYPLQWFYMHCISYQIY